MTKYKEIYYTADEHYSHTNIIRYQNRPFADAIIMDQEIIRRHNSVVTSDDLVVHCGDFTLSPSFDYAMNIIRQLNGSHVFLKGSHDKWLPQKVSKNMGHEIMEFHKDGYIITACHYCMLTYPRSHYPNNYHVFGHSHGHLQVAGPRIDIGVDCHDYYPVSFTKAVALIKAKLISEAAA